MKIYREPEQVDEWNDNWNPDKRQYPDPPEIPSPYPLRAVAIEPVREQEEITERLADPPDDPPQHISEQPRSKPPVSTKGRQCHQHNPLNYDCKKCRKLPNCRAYLGWFEMIPYFILDDYLMKLSGSAVKIFLLLNKTVNYHSGSNYFGRCWLTYDQIQKATGVAKSHMGEYLKELTGHDLIEHVQTRQRIDGKWNIINQFTVRWYRCLFQIEDKRMHGIQTQKLLW